MGKTIRISDNNTMTRLNKHGKKGDSYENIINQLIDKVEEIEK